MIGFLTLDMERTGAAPGRQADDALRPHIIRARSPHAAARRSASRQSAQDWPCRAIHSPPTHDLSCFLAVTSHAFNHRSRALHSDGALGCPRTESSGQACVDRTHWGPRRIGNQGDLRWSLSRHGRDLPCDPVSGRLSDRRRIMARRWLAPVSFSCTLSTSIH